ncbi:MAG: hypothetical protein AMXMBFR77_28160 [Phycisphaerales bacterium]
MPRHPLRALSQPCPWPWYIAGVGGAAGRQRVINQHQHPHYYRTPLPFYLALHASRRTETGAAEYVLGFVWGHAPTEGPRNAIVGVALVAEAVPVEHLYSAGLVNRPGVAGFESGPWCWLLRDVVQLIEPLPCEGRAGLWTPDDPLLDELRRRYATSRSELAAAPRRPAVAMPERGKGGDVPAERGLGQAPAAVGR